jgi:hypothetical protein
MAISDTRLQSRQELWKSKLAVKHLQQQSQPLSAFELSNRRLVSAQKRRKEQQVTEFLSKFSLSALLLAKLNVEPDLKFFKETVQLQEAHNGDWFNTPLQHNLLKPPPTDPRVLNEDQVGYCVNLLRYCAHEFARRERLKHMF